MFIVLSNKSCTQCNIRPCVPERFSYTEHTAQVRKFRRQVYAAMCGLGRNNYICVLK